MSRAARGGGLMGGEVEKGGVVRLMPQGLGLGSSAFWEKMVRKRRIVCIVWWIFVSFTSYAVYKFLLFVLLLHESTIILDSFTSTCYTGVLGQPSTFCYMFSYCEIDAFLRSTKKPV